MGRRAKSFILGPDNPVHLAALRIQAIELAVIPVGHPNLAIIER